MDTMTKVNGSKAPLSEAQKERATAATMWRAARNDGQVMTGKELAAYFGRKERWGQGVIADCKREDAAAQESFVEDEGRESSTEFADATVMSLTGSHEGQQPHDGLGEPHEARIPAPTESPVSGGGYRAVDSEPHGNGYAVPADRVRPSVTASADPSQPHEDLPPTAEGAPEVVFSPVPRVKPRAVKPRPAPKPETVHAAHKTAALRIFYTLVLILALIGQTTAAADWVPIGDAGSFTEEPLFLVARYVVSGVFALVLELGAFVLLLEVADRAATGARSRALPLIGAFTLAGVAAGITTVGHWGDSSAEQIAAVAFCLVTVVGFLTWLIRLDWRIRPEHERRKHVEKAVEAYVKGLDMPAAEKAVLLSSVGADEIAARLTAELDNDAIANRLAAAIDPASWRTADVKAQAN